MTIGMAHGMGAKYLPSLLVTFGNPLHFKLAVLLIHRSSRSAFYATSTVGKLNGLRATHIEPWFHRKHCNISARQTGVCSP